MKSYHISSIIIFIFLISVPLNAAATTCTGSNKNVGDDFTTTNQMDGANTTAIWGGGEIKLPSAASGYVLGATAVFSGLSNYRAVDAGLLDGDSLADLLLVGDGGTISILTQASSFSAATVTNSDTSDIWDVEIADFDGDGDRDFATLDENGDVRIWFNDGSMGFSNSGVLFTDDYAAGSMEKSLSYNAPNLYIGHVQYEGKNAQKGKYYIRVYEITGNGTGYSYNVSNDILPGDKLHMVAAKNLDGINNNDILIAESGSSQTIKLMVTDSGGVYQNPTTVATVSSLTDIEIEDMDGDTDPDFVVSVGAASAAGWYENNGAGSFTYHQFLDGSNNTLSLSASSDLALADLNNDSIQDVFYLDASSGNIRWVLSDASSGYGTSATAQSINLAGVIPTDATIEGATLVSVINEADPRGCDVLFNPLDPGSCIKYSVKNLSTGTPKYFENISGKDTVSFDPGDEFYFMIELAGDGSDTPVVDDLRIQFNYSGERYIYRTESVVDKGMRVLVQGSFKNGAAPTQGMIEAYDLTQVPAARIGTPIKGEVTTITGWNVYTADASGDREIFDYVSAGLTASQVKSLGAIDHSAPVVVRGVVFPQWYYLIGDPANDEKTRFDTFFAANKDRTTYWFIGAKDGTVHTFDGDPDSTTFGHEYWEYLPSVYKGNIADNVNTDLNDDKIIDVEGTLADVYDEAGATYRTLLTFPLAKTRNDIICLDVTDPEDPIVMWEFPGSSLAVTGFSSMDYANLRGVMAIGRILVNNSSGTAKTRFGVFGVSAVPYNVNPETGTTVDGYTVRMFILDALNGELIQSFVKNYDTPLTEYAPPGVSLSDRDRDGYVDIMLYPDLMGDLQAVELGVSTVMGTTTDGDDIIELIEDGDPTTWGQRTFFEDTGATAMAYNRVAIGYGWTGDLLAYYGTAGDGNNRFYAVCVSGSCTSTVGEGEAIYTLGDNESYLVNERVISSPVVINRNVFFIGTSNTYTNSSGGSESYAIDQIIPCDATFPSSTLYSARLGSGSGLGTDIDSGAAHVVTKTIDDTVATAQAVGENIVGVTQDGQVMLEDSPFSPGDEGSGIGDTYIKVLGWIEVQ